MQKVIEALGLGKQQIELIPVNSHFRVDVGALREILLRCADERIPVIALVSVLGSTEEGAVDQIHRLVELQAEMRQQGLAFYHHCDAAWGGYVRTFFFDRQGKPVENAERDPRDHRVVAVGGGLRKLQRRSSRRLDND